jgi:hypothetical protein
MFAPGNSQLHAPLKRPALAVILPQLKRVTGIWVNSTSNTRQNNNNNGTTTTTGRSSSLLLPTRASPVVKEIVAGPYLDALCTGVFDSE